jgi:hypothetical protein
MHEKPFWGPNFDIGWLERIQAQHGPEAGSRKISRACAGPLSEVGGELVSERNYRTHFIKKIKNKHTLSLASHSTPPTAAETL